MRVLVASDIHGSIYHTKKLIERFKVEKAERLILLGDIYHVGMGGENYEYNAQEVTYELNAIWDKVVSTRGNCDSQFDEDTSNFSFIDDLTLNVKDKKVYMAHGHKINWYHPHYYGDIIIFGHLHTGYIKKDEGVIIVNTGSISSPKSGTENSYVILTDDYIELKSLDGEVINSVEFE